MLIILMVILFYMIFSFLPSLFPFNIILIKSIYNNAIKNLKILYIKCVLIFVAGQLSIRHLKYIHLKAYYFI